MLDYRYANYYTNYSNFVDIRIFDMYIFILYEKYNYNA